MLEYKFQNLRRQRFTKDGNLAVKGRSARSSDSIPLLYARLKVEDIHHILRVERVQRLKVFQRQVVDLALTRLGEGDSSSRDVVSLTEGNLQNSLDDS